MNKQLIASICVLGLVGMVVGVVAQADNTVTATVTPGVVSVTVSPGTVPYGLMPMAGTESSDEITATAGTVDVDLKITGSNATYDIKAWTLDSAPGTDVYTHAYTIKDSSWPSSGAALTNDHTTGWDDLTTSAQNLVENLAASAGQTFKLDMRTPSVAGDETVMGQQYSTVVTVMASYAY